MNHYETLWHSRYDYHAVFTCEFCGDHYVHENCYSDYNFDVNVIPAIPCGSCGKKTVETLESQRVNMGIKAKQVPIEKMVWVPYDQ